jgi:hypothetical protein
LKYGYITYGNIKPDQILEDLTKEFAKLKEEAAKHGFNQQFWGHPFGVSENIVIVYESENGVDKYAQFLVSMSGELPYTDPRTNIVNIP